MSKQTGLQVVVLAGGKGVRMRSELPKVLHRICGWTLLSRVLSPAIALRPQAITVVVGYKGELVQEELQRLRGLSFIPSNIEIHTVLQSEQLGTGHATMMAEPALGADEDASVLILPGDAPLLTAEDLHTFAEEHRRRAAELSVMTAIVPDPAGFGRVIRDGRGDIRAIVEKKDCTPEQLPIQEINSSIYLVRLGFLRKALTGLTPENAQKEYYLTDIVSFAVRQGLPVAGIPVSDFRHVLGANDRAELSALEQIRRREINLHLMRSGVTLEDPATTYVDEGISVGPDSFLGAGTRLRGRTQVGDGAVLEGNSLIIDSLIGDGCHIKFSCHIEGARLGARSSAGPFARLRQGTVAHEDVHIGNYVEAKNTEFGPAAKANHFSYLGDSAIGGRSNIGAGTVFCNYDGSKKSRTNIGEQVFVGSNSTLVAPVSVAPGAYIAAGSVITNDVPEKALGLGRARQTNIEGWVERRMKKTETSGK